MNVLPVPAKEYHEKWSTFARVSEFWDLPPADRHMAWQEWTADEHWSEWPIPIAQFVTDPFYVGEGVIIRPKIEDVLSAFWSPRSPYEVWVFIAGIGSGKSFAGALSLVYGIYVLSCMKRPARWLSRYPGVSLSDDAEIVLMNASAAGADQSKKIVYGEAFEKILNSAYFAENCAPSPTKSSELMFPNRVRLTPGTSRWQSALGWNVYGFVIDEAAFGAETERADYVAELFSALNQRRRSRFGRQGFGVLTTSPGHDEAYVEGLARQAGEWDETVLVSRMTTWDAKDELVNGADVFIFDRDPDVMRIKAHDLIFRRPGWCQDKTGAAVRYNDAEHPEPAEEVASP